MFFQGIFFAAPASPWFRTLLKDQFDRMASEGKLFPAMPSTSSYVEMIRCYGDKADFSFIRKYYQRGGMNAFSVDKYQSIFDAQAIVVHEPDWGIRCVMLI